MARKIRLQGDDSSTHGNGGMHRSDLVVGWTALDELLTPAVLDTLDESAKMELKKHLNFCIIEESGTNIDDNSKDVTKVHGDLMENWVAFLKILNQCLADRGYQQTVGLEEVRVFPVVTLGIVLLMLITKKLSISTTDTDCCIYFFVF